MRQYSADNVEIAWNGIDIKAAVVAGTMVQETRTSPTWTQTVSMMGEAYRAKNPDRSGTLTITIMRDHPVYQQLMDAYEADALNLNQVFPLVIKSINSGRSLVYKNAYITTGPDESFEMAASQISVVWAFEKVFKKNAENPNQNVVGS